MQIYLYTFVYIQRFTHNMEITSIILNFVYLLFFGFRLFRISSTLSLHTHANRDLSAKEKNGRARQKYTHTNTHAWSCVRFCTCAAPVFFCYENLARLNFGASIRGNQRQMGEERIRYVQYANFDFSMSFVSLRVVYMSCVREQQITTKNAKTTPEKKKNRSVRWQKLD